MKDVQSVYDFKQILRMNRDKIFANVVEAKDIPVNDEWMQEKRWDEIYKQENKQYGEI